MFASLARLIPSDAVVRLEIAGVAFAICATAAIVLEIVRPARPVDYRSRIAPELVGFLLYQLVVFPVAVAISDPSFAHLRIPATVGLHSGLPLALRVLGFYLGADLGSYCMHRLMHTRYVWRIHKFHHAPIAIWWLAGARASIPQQILFNLPYVVCLPLIAGAPHWVYLAIMVEGIFRNIWMHTNITWRSNWLEWIFVTPRYHHIHHSDEPQHHDSNFGSLFAIWDRVFGTYTSPDATTPRTFGCGETADTPKKRAWLFAKQQIGV